MVHIWSRNQPKLKRMAAPTKAMVKSGAVHAGLVVERGETLEIYPPDAKAEPARVKRSDVAKVERVPVSQMPPGLLNLLNGDELRDLMAYLMSAGDPKDKVYGK